jgi:transketolase
MRNAIIQQIVELAEKDNRIWLLTGDLGYKVLEPFKDKFPDRFINCGNAEANMIGVATGMALKGKVVFVYSITPFIVFHAFEQVRMMSHMNAHVILLGSGVEHDYHNDGISHYADGDKEVMETLPIQIYSPTSIEEGKNAVINVYNNNESAYIRIKR